MALLCACACNPILQGKRPAPRESIMFLNVQKPLIRRVVLILAIVGEVMSGGGTAQVSAASSFLQSDTCVPNTGWVWTSGPSRPDIAQQAGLALSNEGLKAVVAANDYGEVDACGNFELFSTDFTVTLKNNSNPKLSPDAQSEMIDRVRALLQPFGQPQLGNVRIDFGDGAAKSYGGPLDVQNSLPTFTAASESISGSSASLNKKVLLLVYNPTLSNGQDLNTYMGWPAHMMLVQGVIDSFLGASHGQLQYTVVETQVVANEWPVKADGFRYTESTYLAVMQNSALAHSPDEVDYNAIIDNPQFDICGKLNRGEIDELWMYGAPYFGFYESRLVGPGAYSYNSPPMNGTHNCNKLLPIMGLSYERGVAEAVHSFGHRAEASMTKVYGSWQQNRTSHNWDRFGLSQVQSPNYSYSGCGTIHYPPNALSAYDYGNPGSASTDCEDFRNYPALSDPLSVSQPITCTGWNCNQLDFMVYWFGHLPATTGCGPDAVENNWWNYFVDPSLALFPSLNCPSIPPDPILPGNTVRVSLNSAGGQTLGDSLSPSMSADGHYVAFQSAAANLVAGDTNGVDDIFLRDLQTGTIRRVSVSSSGVQGDGYSMDPTVSADGRYIAFYSFSTNLVPGDTNGTYDIFVHDIQTGLTTRISLDSNEVQANGLSHFPAISADGRYIAFFSAATNLVSGDTNGMNDIFVRDLQSGTTVRASVSSTGAQGNNFSSGPAISADGRYVAFYSYASNLVSGDTNGRVDIFVRDLQSGVTTRVSVDSSGLQANNDSFNPALSADGRYIAFEGNATNLVSGDTNARNDIFVHDLQTGITTRVSVSSSGTQGNNFSVSASISGDGRYVTYYSGATNLVSGDTNGWDDTFVRDIQTGTTARVSVSSTGAQANNSSGSPFLSADGQTILFRAYATNLVPSDTNGMPDIFLHRLNTPLPPASTSTFTPVATKTTTPTPTKTNTPTITSTSGPVSNNPLYISLANSQTIGSVAAADEDILKFDGSNWSLFFDGSDVGVGSPDLFAFSIVDADTLLLSFNSAVTVNGIAATPQDILRFDATSLGSTTSGTWSMYFDGSDAGLEDATTEKIDSLSLLPGGRLLISTTGN